MTQHLITVDELALSVPCESAAAADDLTAMGNEITLAEYGAWASRHYTPPFLVAGRPLTNVEMLAIKAASIERDREAAAEQGCCNELGCEDDGRCRGSLGACPLVTAAKRLAFKIWRDRNE